MEEASANLIIVGNGLDSVVAIEGHATTASHTTVNSAIKFGLEACDTIAQAIGALAQKFGKQKQYAETDSIDSKIINTIREQSKWRLAEIFKNHRHSNQSRMIALNKIRDNVADVMLAMHPEIGSAIISAEYDKIVKETFRENIFDGKRCDGRRHAEMRPIKCSVNLQNSTHGSALFEVGKSQVMSVVALDSDKSDKTVHPQLDEQRSKRFTSACAPSKRGQTFHGAERLAEMSLSSNIPDDCQYNINCTTHVLASDGPTSPASVSAGSLALLDAGISIKNPVAGVSIGLITKYDSNDSKKLRDYRILTDITVSNDF